VSRGVVCIAVYETLVCIERLYALLAVYAIGCLERLYALLAMYAIAQGLEK